MNRFSKIWGIIRRLVVNNKGFVKKILLISLSVIVFILMLATLLFQLNKDKIASTLLLKVNEYQNGELVFDDLSFNPFIHFPDVSIVLEEIRYYEEKQALSNADTLPILSLEKLYIDFNLIDLLKTEVNAPNIHLANGRLNIYKDEKGVLNIIKAVEKSKPIKPAATKQKTKPVKSDSLKKTKPTPQKKAEIDEQKESTEELSLDLEKIYLSNIDVVYKDPIEQISSYYQLQSLQASLHYSSDTILCSLDTELYIIDAIIANSFRVDSVQVSLNTRLNFDKRFENIRIEPSQLEVDRASFLAHGVMAFNGNGQIDMKIEGVDEDFGILNLIFTNIGIDNIEQGELFFDASIKGSLRKGFPRIKSIFGINDLQISIPSTSQKVSNLKMRANFDSGELDKFEGASFQISELSANLPKGKLNGNLEISNFLSPRISVDIFAKSEIRGFEKLMKHAKLEKMAGMLEFKSKFKGEFDRENNAWNKEADYSHIIFKDILISKTSEKKVDNINGKISLSKNKLVVDSLYMVIDKTDILLNGSLSNLKLLMAKLSSTKNPFNEVGGIYFPLDTTQAADLNIDIGLNANLNNLRPFLPANSLDSLSGEINITSNFNGLINWDADLIESIAGQLNVEFKDVAMAIPNVNTIRNMNGSILMSNRMTYFNNLQVDYGKSDVLIKGSVSNLPYLILDVDKPIEADLLIESDVFDYPDAFSYDSFVAAAFPYKIKNIHLEVAPKTTTNGVRQFIQTPRLAFNISQLEAEVEDFLPPISISNGYFLLSDKADGINLDFDDFNIKVLNGRAKADVEIQTSKKSDNWLKVQTDLGNVNIKQTFTHWADSIPDYFDGVLGGKANVDMTFGRSKVKFDKVNLSSSKLVYKNKEDTIQLSGLKLGATGFDYQSSSGFLQTLSFESDLFIKTFSTKMIKTDSLRYNITAKKSEFTVVPTGRNFLKDKGEGLYIFKPFSNPPEFDFKYKVDHFNIADLLLNFRDDPVIDGQMKLDIHLNMMGDSQKELLQNLNGYMSLYGKDLSLTGLDIDKLIERFKRSQRFTFADVGAVVLMGPLGLLVSKGSDYTGMVLVDKDYVSSVHEFASDYSFKNGLINFKDVALSTELNRIAASGSVDLKKDSLDITVSLLNEKGCSIFSQKIAGSMINSERGKIDAGKLILAPITNLAKKTVGIDCKVVYDGQVAQPEKK